MILQGDALEELRKLPDKCCSVCVTSPPYYNARDYGAAEQLGTESSPEEYTRKLVEAFREVARVLKDDGTLWLNIGDSYARHIEDGGIKRKDLIGIPWLLALALRSDGWYLRADIIWNKPNAMPESAKDRPARSHEYVFFTQQSGRLLLRRRGRQGAGRRVRSEKARPETRQCENLPRWHCLHSRSGQSQQRRGGSRQPRAPEK